MLMTTEGGIWNRGKKPKWKKSKWEKRLDILMVALAVETAVVVGIILYETLARIP